MLHHMHVHMQKTLNNMSMFKQDQNGGLYWNRDVLKILLFRNFETEGQICTESVSRHAYGPKFDMQTLAKAWFYECHFKHS